jgi:hypothetical protein
MIPVKTELTNWDYHLPDRPGEGVMPCVRDITASTVRSFWRPSDEDEIVEGKAVYVQVYGSRAPIKVGFANDEGRAVELVECSLVPYDGGGQTNVVFNKEVVEHMVAGGYFCLEVNRVPPFPVAVWIA